MRRIPHAATALILISGILAVSIACAGPPARTSGPIDQDVYVWQRAWNDSVRESISVASQEFVGLVALGAEVSFEQGEPRVIRVATDHEKLVASGMEIGLALRIGPWSGPFSEDDELASLLADLAVDLIADAEESGPAVRELQIDFDCPESGLDGYRLWVNAIRREIEPVSLTITALPAWLRHPEFRRLAEAADGYVLQVHSLEPPESIEGEFTLCDPDRSIDWIERAARLGLPFKVALPTYGYLVAFDAGGDFIGLSAEGAAVEWPVGTQLTEIRSDPVEIADLVSSLTDDRPENLVGLIWYRMPVSSDRLNWPWPTLKAVMSGRMPVSDLSARALRPEPGLVDIELANVGELDELPAVVISVRWEAARLLAYDVLRGFMCINQGPGMIELRGPQDPFSIIERIGPGEKWLAGWFRFDRDTEVEVGVSRLQHTERSESTGPH